MSLDVYLTIDTPIIVAAHVPVRENGTIVKMTAAEYVAKYEREPVSVIAKEETCQVFHGNITGNLFDMAKAAKLHSYLWTPNEIGICTASKLLPFLVDGYLLAML